MVDNSFHIEHGNFVHVYLLEFYVKWKYIFRPLRNEMSQTMNCLKPFHKDNGENDRNKTYIKTLHYRN